MLTQRMSATLPPWPTEGSGIPFDSNAR
jgi:hypothetical protein